MDNNIYITPTTRRRPKGRRTIMDQETRRNNKRNGKEMNIIHKENENALWLEREYICEQAWLYYVQTHDIPDDIPARPDLVYANEGWWGWQDWIGMTDTKEDGGQP